MRAWVGFGAVDAAAVCVAGVALGDIERRCAWQAWHLATWTSTLRGGRGTYGTGLALVARLGWICCRGRRRCLRGRRGTWRHRASLCVAGMALGDMDLHFAWQAWHLWHWTGSGGALGLDLAPWTPVLFAWQAWHLGTSRSLCVASVAHTQLVHAQLVTHNLSHTTCPRTTCPHTTSHTTCHHTTCSHTTCPHTTCTWRHRPSWHLWHWTGSGGALGLDLAPWTPPLFAWQAWHLATWTSTLRGRRGTYGTGLALVVRLGWIWRRGRRRCLRGRRGTWRHRASLCAAGMALGDMDLHFAWQAWHLWYRAGSGGALGLDLAPWTPQLFAWQAWHLATSSVALRGRRGTWRHGPSLCVAGVTLMALCWLCMVARLG